MYVIIFQQMLKCNFAIPGHGQIIFKTPEHVQKHNVKEQFSAFKMYGLISVWYSKWEPSMVGEPLIAEQNESKERKRHTN